MPVKNDLIHISPTLSLPQEAVTETFGFLAMRGAGKSNAVVVMAEEMYRLGLPWVAIDPKGDWWGIRSNAKGTGPGLPIPIFGGLHGDVPLEAEAGAFIAELIVRENLTCILDVSEFESKAKRARFLTDFADHLYRLHGKEPQPRHIFAEEADQYIPQRVMADMAKCVGAWEQIIKLGRQRGLGCSVVTQRSASINKDALSQVLTLVAMRTTSPHDRKAILGWVDYHAVGREIVDALPKLPSGSAWIISPQWLGKVEEVTFNRRSTFDSGETPKMGKTRRVATLADIDFGSLAKELADTIERATADDPKALRKRIAELERELAKKSVVSEVETVTVYETVEVPAPYVPESILSASQDLHDAFEKMMLELRSVDVEPKLRPAPHREVKSSRPAPVTSPVRERPLPTPGPVSQSEPAGTLKKAERSILSVLAQFPDGRTKRQLAMLSGYAIGGGFNNAVGSLRSSGYINKAGEPILILPHGLVAIEGNYEPLPEGRALLDFWLGKLARAERLILSELVESWPNPMSKEELAERTGYAIAGGFNNALGRLRTLQLITRGVQIFADETLAEEVRGG